MKSEERKRMVRELASEFRSPTRATRTAVRAPLEAAAARRVDGIRRYELVDLVQPDTYQVTISASSTRHAWSLGAAEQIILQLLIKQRSITRAFEIGTFNGGSTRVIAEALPADGGVVTLDLPPAAFDLTQSPDAFRGGDVGSAFRDSPAKDKICQELCDSLTFDFSQYSDGFDMVLVDGAHDYEHGYSDSLAALEVVAPGGIILWDDFEPYWHGLINGILDAVGSSPIGKLAGTSFAVLEVPQT